MPDVAEADAGARRRRHRCPWLSADAGGPGSGQQGGPRAARTRSIPASPATRPALITATPARSSVLPGQSARLSTSRVAPLRRPAGPAADWLWWEPAPPASPTPRWRPSAGDAGDSLIEAADEIGGQFNLARRIPGKEEFERDRCATIGGNDRRHWASICCLGDADADSLERAKGLRRGARWPRACEPAYRRTCPEVDHPKDGHATTSTLISQSRGPIGAAGRHHRRWWHRLRRGRVDHACRDLWGAGHRGVRRQSGASTSPTIRAAGLPGVTPARPSSGPRGDAAPTQAPTPFGKGLGRTTGWTHRLTLMQGEGREDDQWCRELPEDRRPGPAHPDSARTTNAYALSRSRPSSCAPGRTPRRSLHEALLAAAGVTEAASIGGAFQAVELDAKRAINQGSRLAATV